MRNCFCLRTGCFALVTVAILMANLNAQDEFKVEVKRQKTESGLVVGEIKVNGNLIGSCYEHPMLKIPVGKYAGKIRTTSGKNFVQGPGGVLNKSGDFLLEITGVPKRTDILFHAGNKPEHTEGCILCGPAITKDGKKYAPETLKQLRTLFFGSDKPSATPNKKIVITIVD